jgi:DHA1 family tetracycline resistance protein-like MFS transporter
MAHPATGYPAAMAAWPPTSDPAALRLALGVSFLNGLGFGLVFPVAAYAASELSLSPAGATVVVGLHPLVRVLAAPAWGRWSDRVGRRPALLGGTLLAAAGHACFAGSPGLAGLVAARLLTGLGAGDGVAAAALVADVTAAEDRPAALGLLRAAQGLGMLLGPVAGGALGWGSLRAPAAAAVGVSLVAAAAAAAWRPRGAPRVDRGPVAVDRWLLGAAAASAGALALAEAVVPFAVRDVLVPALGWAADPGDVAIGLLVAVLLGFGVTLATVDAGLSGRLVTRFGPKGVATTALVAWAVAFAATPPVYAAGVGPGALALVAAAAPAALAGTALAAWISTSAPPERQGAALGALAGAVAIGEAVGPLCAGLLYERGLAWPYVAAAAALGAAAVVTAHRPGNPVG